MSFGMTFNHADDAALKTGHHSNFLKKYSFWNLNIPNIFQKIHIMYICITVRKFHSFYITQILREINCGDSRSPKSTHLEAVNFLFYEFLRRDPKIAKTAVLELLDSQWLISRKIWMIGKSWNVHTVCISSTCILMWHSSLELWFVS